MQLLRKYSFMEAVSAINLGKFSCGAWFWIMLHSQPQSNWKMVCDDDDNKSHRGSSFFSSDNHNEKINQGGSCGYYHANIS